MTKGIFGYNRVNVMKTFRFGTSPQQEYDILREYPITDRRRIWPWENYRRGKQTMTSAGKEPTIRKIIPRYLLRFCCRAALNIRLLLLLVILVFLLNLTFLYRHCFTCERAEIGQSRDYSPFDEGAHPRVFRNFVTPKRVNFHDASSELITKVGMVAPYHLVESPKDKDHGRASNLSIEKGMFNGSSDGSSDGQNLGKRENEGNVVAKKGQNPMKLVNLSVNSKGKKSIRGKKADADESKFEANHKLTRDGHTATRLKKQSNYQSQTEGVNNDCNKGEGVQKHSRFVGKEHRDVSIRNVDGKRISSRGEARGKSEVDKGKRGVPITNRSADVDVKHVNLIGHEKTRRQASTAGHESHHISYKANCVKFMSIYTRSMSPFAYWPEYAELRKLFEDGRRFRGNDDSFPTAYIECPDHPCDINIKPTDDHLVLRESDAVLLNIAPLVVRHDIASISEHLLTILPPQARIIFYAMESAAMMHIWDNTIKDIRFHLSMTYHSSSDIVHPYGRYVPGRPMDRPGQPVRYTEGKTRLVAWMASNCNNTLWPRFEWVRGLQNAISVDTYGGCGDLDCSPRFSENCSRVIRSYKFYLALENTECDEYITEKFWENSLLNGVVPVVYGGRKTAYERLAPVGSFIFAGDFATHQELADYLVMLDKHDDRYEEYFAWRRMGSIEKVYPTLQPGAFCDLLPFLSADADRTFHSVRHAGDTGYFTSCRDSQGAGFTNPGDIGKWTAWKSIKHLTI